MELELFSDMPKRYCDEFQGDAWTHTSRHPLLEGIGKVPGFKGISSWLRTVLDTEPGEIDFTTPPKYY